MKGCKKRVVLKAKKENLQCREKRGALKDNGALRIVAFFGGQRRPVFGCRAVPSRRLFPPPWSVQQQTGRRMTADWHGEMTVDEDSIIQAD